MDALTSLLRCADPLKLTVLEQRAQLQDSVGKSKAAKEKCEKMLRMIGESSFWRRVEEITSYLLPIKVLAIKSLAAQARTGTAGRPALLGQTLWAGTSRNGCMHTASAVCCLAGRPALRGQKAGAARAATAACIHVQPVHAMHDAR